MRPLKAAVAATILCAATVLAQNDNYSRIKPLEEAMATGQASHAQQIELARLYNQSGRYYEATKIADRVLAWSSQLDPSERVYAQLPGRVATARAGALKAV